MSDAALRVLALEPYYGGSHRAFLDRWRERSAHAWTLQTLSAHHWKWRMRHSAVTFAEAVARRLAAGERWDAVVASDMLDVATWHGLAPTAMRAVPLVLYMHENQLTYPVNEEHATDLSHGRDQHFAFTNFTSMLAADAVWFNSAYHRDEFFTAMRQCLKRMPGHAPLSALDGLREKVAVVPPGIDAAAFGAQRPARTSQPRSAAEPLQLVWAARWEHDKGPEVFFDALKRLVAAGKPVRASVLGEQFRKRPAVFDEARTQLGAVLTRWGYAESRQAYAAALAEADVFVSTAHHEFFGLAVLEALAAGCVVVAPHALAYPETLGPVKDVAPQMVHWHANTPDSLAEVLATLAAKPNAAVPPQAQREAVQANILARFDINRHAPRLDRALKEVIPPR